MPVKARRRRKGGKGAKAKATKSLGSVQAETEQAFASNGGGKSKVIKESVPNLVKGISVCENKDLALQGSNGLVVMTEWGEFRYPSFEKIKMSLETPVIFDARNLFPTEKVLEEGMDYFAIGKKVRGS